MAEANEWVVHPYGDMDANYRIEVRRADPPGIIIVDGREAFVDMRATAHIIRDALNGLPPAPSAWRPAGKPLFDTVDKALSELGRIRASLEAMQKPHP